MLTSGPVPLDQRDGNASTALAVGARVAAYRGDAVGREPDWPRVEVLED